ncbi:MAG: hypothetical protein M5R40_11525 [Anaerolineae bacterium]|nr:hypothetical protein [Anaerolineae bacterium]
MMRWLAALGLRRYDALILVAALASTALYVAAAGGEGFPLDDGWIHQVYARNLAERGEWAFTPGAPSAGSTAPLWTALLAVGHGLGVPYRLWALALGALCLALTGMLGARIAERLFPGVRHVGPLAGLGVALEWHLIWAAASGMETALFVALGMGVMALTSPSSRRAAHRRDTLSPLHGEGMGGEVASEVREDESTRTTGGATAARGLALGVVSAALTATRPEGVLLVGLAGLLGLAHGGRRALAWGGGVAAGWLIGVAPVALLNLSLSGTVLPNTSAAKQAEYSALLSAPYLKRLLDVCTPLTAGVALPLLPGAVWAVAARVRALRRNRGALAGLLPLVWALALVMLYAARLPVTYQHGRYVIPALPPLIVVGVGGTLLLLRAGRRRLPGRVLRRALALAAVGILLMFWVIGLRAYDTDVSIIQTEMVAAARYLAEAIPPEDLLAVHDIGAVGYFAPRPILDLAGLVSPEVIPIIRDEPALLALMEARGAAYLMTFPGWYPEIVADPRVAPVYRTSGTAPAAGGENMAIYRLDWGSP